MKIRIDKAKCVGNARWPQPSRRNCFRWMGGLYRRHEIDVPPRHGRSRPGAAKRACPERIIAIEDDSSAVAPEIKRDL